MNSSPKCSGLLVMICLAASIGGFLFGFDTAVISGTFGFVQEQFRLNAIQVGWFGSSALWGCIAGAAVAGYLGDRYGRKPILIFSSVCFFVSALYSTIPDSFTVLMAARVLGGIGVGMASVLAPMFIAEFAPGKVRGRLVSLYQLSIVIGVLAAYFSNQMLLEVRDSSIAGILGETASLRKIFVTEVWRAMFGAEMVPGIVFIVLLLVMPESPRFLAARGRDSRALEILSRLNDAETARIELADIRRTMNREDDSIWTLFRPGMRKALLAGIGLSFFGQMSGVNIVIYYGPEIIKNAGIDIGGAMRYQVFLGIINLIFTVIALCIVDKYGRRPLLIWGMGVVALTLIGAGVLFQLGAPAWVLIMVLGLYSACVAISICAVIWVLTPEIFPNKIRGRAMSVAVFVNWSTNSFSALLFPSLVAALGMGMVFLIFGLICVIATVFFYFLIPETKGRSLEEIETIWSSSPTAS